MQRFNVPGPKAQAIIERDHKVVSPSYPRGYPFVMSHGRGTEVWDVDGNRYLDFSAGIAVVSTGHSHPKVVQAIQQQAEQFLHISSDYYHPRWVELAEKLASIAPFAEPAMTFVANSGAEAVETAMKLAKYYTGRHQFIAFLGSFHGRTMGAVTATGSKYTYRRKFGPLVNGIYHVPYPNPYRPILLSEPGEGYGETVVRYIEEQILGRLVAADEVAGILIEPIQGEGGYVIPPADFFPALRKLCDKHGILLIADEVQSGMGRTGKWWAIENFGVEPDIVCSAKGIASGIPLGAVIARRHLMTWTKGAHGNTYGGNPIAAVASLATMELIENGMMQNAREIGEYALQRLHALMQKHACIGDVRGIGLMIGVEFVENRQTKKPAAHLRDRIVDLAFEHGMLTLGCGRSTIRISPPLNVTRAEMDEALEIFDYVIELAQHEAVAHPALPIAAD
ncbi:MAG: acetyl ornithine aminotransferase family protein [Anaerolineales bacterium]